MCIKKDNLRIRISKQEKEHIRNASKSINKSMSEFIISTVIKKSDEILNKNYSYADPEFMESIKEISFHLTKDI